MKSWVLTLIGVLTAASHVLSSAPGWIGQAANFVFAGGVALLGGGAAGTADKK